GIGPFSASPSTNSNDEVVRPHVIELADMRMVQGRHGTSFALEAFAELVDRDLDGDIPVQARIAGAINLTHPPSANEREDFVRSEASSRRKPHIDQARGLTEVGCCSDSRSTPGRFAVRLHQLLPLGLLPVVGRWIHQPGNPIAAGAYGSRVNR